MPFPLIIIGFLILLGFSGGLQGGLAPDSEPAAERESPVVRGASDSNEGFFRSRFARSSDNQSEAVDPLDFGTPTAQTLAARNLEATSATVRGSVMMRTYKDGKVFVVYGYNQERVQRLAQAYRTNEVMDRDDRAQALVIDKRAHGSEAYERRLSNLAKDTTYYFTLCVEYTTVANRTASDCGDVKTFITNEQSSSGRSFREPRVSVRSPQNVTASEAEFTGRVTMNDGVDGIPFLVYGESESLVRTVQERATYSSIREADEDLQKVRIAVGLRGQYDFTVPIADLDTNQLYYYRTCVEYDGERNGLVCDNVRSFTTDSRDRGDRPRVETGTGTVSGTRATIRGGADMQDFFDGIAFFVYGTDEARVQGDETAGSFARISQSIDRLQRISVDDDFDGKADFSRQVSDLLPATEYHYRLCVQYEDEDERGRETLFLRCGDAKSFTTGR